MVHTKRAVSPLIASILLIALTVSIGAMVIGWGRQYIQQQTSCLGVSLSITDAEVNIQTQTQTATLTLWIQNTGSQNVKNSDLIIYYYNIDGTRNTIELQDTDNFEVGDSTTQVLRPGQVGKLEKTGLGVSSCDNILEVEIERVGCGVVSNKFSIYKCQS